jgi:hypothetical protein
MSEHRRRNPHGLSRTSKRALILLEAVAPARGVVSTGSTAIIDGQLWMHWRTAYALHERGLARVIGEGEEAEVVLS